MPAQSATGRHEPIVYVKVQPQGSEWPGQCEYSVYLLGYELLQIYRHNFIIT